MSSVTTYASILDNEQIASFFSLEEVQIAKQKIDARQSGSVYFTVNVTETIRTTIKNKLGLDLSSVVSIPMRWMKGDTAPHVDVGVSTFENTYLMYLTDSAGELVVDGNSYPITKGSAYVFPECLQHETIHTGAEPRLLLGPMSEYGFAVGGFGINGPGGTSVYFRQFDGSYEYSVDQTLWNEIISLPIYVSNTNTATGVLTIEFVSDITFDNANHYFICTSSHIQYGSSSLKTDGTRPIITIDGVSDYPGLIENGTSMGNGYSNIYIYNLVVNANNGSILANSCGWIGRDYFGKAAIENYIVNCSSNGAISNGGGGIVGSSAGGESGASLTIIGCSSSGIIGPNGGGIVGSLGGTGSGSITCESCWSTGLISGDAGGIMGSLVEYAIISNCYSTGAISANGGGICGSSCAVFSRNVTITNCYSQGSMGGSNSGGIVGYQAGTVIITNCYSLGNMASASSGGIIGAPVGSGTKVITHCYTIGSVTGGTGYITGSSATVNGTCYSEAKTGTPGTWNSTNASAYLLETPTSVVGITWVATVANQPYELLNMGYTPYTIANIDTTTTPMLKRSFASSSTVGSSTTPAIISGKNYTILEITGGDTGSYSSITSASSTGVISTTASTVVGVYTIYIRNNGSYNITEYILTLTSGGGGGGEDNRVSVPCCQLPIFRRGPIVDNTTYTELIAGNTFLGSVRRGNIPYYQIMAMKKSRASK